MTTTEIYGFTPAQLTKLMMDVISLAHEYENIHGFDREAARFAAVNETWEALDGELDMLHYGEIQALSLQTDVSKLGTEE